MAIDKGSSVAKLSKKSAKRVQKSKAAPGKSASKKQASRKLSVGRPAVVAARLRDASSAARKRGSYTERVERIRKAGNTALDRLQVSLESAESALNDLRAEVKNDPRDLLKRIDTTLQVTRKNLVRNRKWIVEELDHVKEAVVESKAAAGRLDPRRKATRPAAASSSRGATASKAKPKPSPAKQQVKKPAKAAAATKVKPKASTAKRAVKPAGAAKVKPKAAPAKRVAKPAGAAKAKPKAS